MTQLDEWTDDFATMDAGLKHMAAEGGGAWRISLWMSETLRQILFSRTARTADDATIVRYFGTLGMAISNAPAHEPKQCLTCEQAFGVGEDEQWPKACCVLHADVPKPTGAFVNGICEACVAAHDDAALEVLIMGRLSSLLNTTFRQAPPIWHAAGHA